MTTFVAYFQSTWRMFDRVVGNIAGLLLLWVTFVVFTNAVARYSFSVSFLGGQELSRLLTVWLTFLAAYPMVRNDGHVTIDLLLRAVPPTVQRIFRGLIALLGTITMFYVTIMAWKLVVHSFNAGQTGTTLPVPRALFFLPLLIGSALMTIAFAEKLLQSLTNRLTNLPSITGNDDSA